MNRNSKVDPVTYMKTKMYLKLLAMAVICFALALIMGKTFNDEPMMAALPAVLGAAPIAIGIYYTLLFRSGRTKTTVCVLVDKKRNIISDISTVSINKYKYFFEYTADDGEIQSFMITRSGRSSSLNVGHEYLVLHRASADPSASNFIDYTYLKVHPKNMESED